MSRFWRNLAVIVGATGACIHQLPAQTMMRPLGSDGTVQLVGSDAAILDLGEPRKDLPCGVTQIKPAVGFDMKFHSGYDIAMPLRELAGEGDELTVIFRVIPETAKDSPRYFVSKYTVPEIQDDAKGDAMLQGGFDVGEGKYHVDWMMRDRLERVCASNWDITAELAGRDQGMKLAITPTAIQQMDGEYFREEPPIARSEPEKAISVKILINYAPQQDSSAAMMPIDASALASILRNISREPAITKFSVVAFNMNEQRVVYREDDAKQIDFPALGQALKTIKFGTVDYKLLAEKHSGPEFLANLVREELGNNSADAVIFAGPKILLEESFPDDSLNALANVKFPVFFMNYNLAPQQAPWRDMIGTVVRKVRGVEYTISRPRDLWTSWTDIMGRMSKLKLVAGSAASQH